MRSLRKHGGLSQRDLSYLLHYQPGCLSKLESGKKSPVLRVALAYQVIFDVPPHELVPRKHAEIERTVRARAGTLADKLSSRQMTPTLTERIALLRSIENGDALHRTYGKTG